jgi:hypothetical protein
MLCSLTDFWRSKFYFSNPTFTTNFMRTLTPGFWLALKCPDKIFMWFFRFWSDTPSSSSKICPLCHQFVRAHSVRYHTLDFKVLYIRHRATNNFCSLNSWSDSPMYEKPVPKWWIASPSPQKSVLSFAGSLPPLSLTSCATTRSNSVCQFTCYCFQWTCSIQTRNVPCSKSHIHFPLPRSFQKNSLKTDALRNVS